MAVKTLDLGEALELAAKHGVEIRASPLIVRRRPGGLTLYLPGYIVNIESSGRVTILSASECTCNCDSSGW